MNISNIYKYYDYRYDFHRYYISPVEFKKELLEKEKPPEYQILDTVSISKEALIKYKNIYGNCRLVTTTTK